MAVKTDEKLATYLFMCCYCTFKVSQQVVSVPKVPIRTALSRSITQLLHQGQICSVRENYKNKCYCSVVLVHYHTLLCNNEVGYIQYIFWQM